MKSTTTITTVVEAEDPEKSKLINLLIRCQPFVAEAAGRLTPGTESYREANDINIDVLPIIFPSVIQALADARRKADETSGVSPRGKFYAEIAACHAAIVGQVVEQSRILRAWYAQLGSDGFDKAVTSDFPHTASTCMNLMSICQNSAIANPRNWSRLPSAPTTLHRLALIRPDILDKLIKEGRVHMNTIMSEANGLAAEFRHKQETIPLPLPPTT